jgi:hypothetical protein
MSKLGIEHFTESSFLKTMNEPSRIEVKGTEVYNPKYVTRLQQYCDKVKIALDEKTSELLKSTAMIADIKKQLDA